MANRQVAKDVSDNVIAGAVMAEFFLDKASRLIEAHASDHTRVTVNKGGYLIPLRIGDNWFLIDTATDVDLDTDMDAGAKAAGTDYFVYACTDGTTLSFKISANSTTPTGFDADHSRKIGGFHTLCAAVGTIADHPLSDYAQTDILPASIWDLKHRARCGNNAGLRYVSGIGKWVQIYLPSGTGVNTQSVYGGTISDTRTQMDFVDDGAACGMHLLTDEECAVAFQGANEQTNIAGSADPVTTGGHVDTAGRRMISNTGGEDECGVVWQWTRTQSFRRDADGTMIAASKTATAYHAAEPGGNPVCVKYGPGRPYLCCNMAADAVDKWVTFGAAVTVCIRHDADAATGGYPLFIDEDAAQPGRLLCALPGLKNDYLDTSDPNYPLRLTYNANPGSVGVALNYNDGADERLEFVSPTSANAAIDLASFALTYGWYALPGGKGQLYRQGPYGDIKLIAGGAWTDRAHCGSRSRNANGYRWYAYSNIGARFASEPL